METDVASLNESMKGLTTRDRSNTEYTQYQPETECLYDRTFATPIGGEKHRYYFPVDAPEQLREEACNTLWTNFVGLPLLLNPESTVLDLGAGWGTWANNMASLFPGSVIVALDSYFDSSQYEAPGNCMLEAGNYEDPYFLYGWEHPTTFIHLRDSYFSLREPPEFAKNVFAALCDGGCFQNEEIRLENWESNKPNLREWLKRTVNAARSLGIPLPSAQDIITSLKEAGFLIESVRTDKWITSKWTTAGALLLEVVKLTVNASARILVEGGSCTSDDVWNFLAEVGRELEEEDCVVVIEAEMVLARKLGDLAPPR
ncbi:hypothetical protein CLCR_10581 [Cladophialophora carrionii]|uniref:S-adenosyl-L-methionine-dependent methyltransferase n=1 Tax=Cladophialophora carrionii TaxID=86049 RepID=A0A1C1CWC4_9EURO|nr:hypothetical protein CLCR_10581 [Cladophialophora carrionii]